MYILPANLGSNIFKVLIMKYMFLFYYRTDRRSYRTLSMRESRVLISHQPHHGWCLLILSPSSTIAFALATTNSPATTRDRPDMSPSPLMRDVGSIINTPGCTEDTAATPAPPLSKGMWAGLYSLDRGNWGWVNTRGDPWSGRPVQCVTKTGYDVCRSSFSPIPPHWPIWRNWPTQHTAATEERRQRRFPLRKPLPSAEGCGFHRHHSSLRSEGAAAAAPPLSKGMWVVYARSTVLPTPSTTTSTTTPRRNGLRPLPWR